MKEYHINDISVGDIYEDWIGNYWIVRSTNPQIGIINSIQIDGEDAGEMFEHKLDDVRQLWYLDRH